MPVHSCTAAESSFVTLSFYRRWEAHVSLMSKANMCKDTNYQLGKPRQQ